MCSTRIAIIGFRFFSWGARQRCSVRTIRYHPRYFSIISQVYAPPCEWLCAKICATLRQTIALWQKFPKRILSCRKLMRRLKCLLLLTNSQQLMWTCHITFWLAILSNVFGSVANQKNTLLTRQDHIKMLSGSMFPHVAGLYLTRRTYPSTSTRRSVFFHIICIWLLPSFGGTNFKPSAVGAPQQVTSLRLFHHYYSRCLWICPCTRSISALCPTRSTVPLRDRVRIYADVRRYQPFISLHCVSTVTCVISVCFSVYLLWSHCLFLLLLNKAVVYVQTPWPFLALTGMF